MSVCMYICPQYLRACVCARLGRGLRSEFGRGLNPKKRQWAEMSIQKYQETPFELPISCWRYSF